MKTSIKENLIKDHNNRMDGIERMFKDLYEYPETAPVIAKLESMYPPFLYGCFSEVFTGFDSVQEAENTLSVLINALIDDSELYFETYVANQDIMDRMNSNPKFKGLIEPEIETRLTYNETDRYVSSTSIMEYINDEEIKQIQNINMFFNMSKVNKSLETAFECSECWTDWVKSFYPENLTNLEPELKQYFNV